MDINLLPWRTYSRIKKSRQQKTGFLICLIILILLGVFYKNKYTYSPRPPLPHLRRAPVKLFIKPAPISLSSVTISQMKYVGFLQDDYSVVGLIMLKNGKTYTVSSGAIIGREKGRVITINPHSLLIDLAGKQLKLT